MRPPTVRVPAAIAGFAVLVAYAWWAVARPPFSASATAAVLLAGIIAAAAGVVGGRPRRRDVPVRRSWAWLVVLAVGGLWQLAAYLQQPRHEHPTISSLVNALLGSQPARVAAFVLWILATVELARR